MRFNETIPTGDYCTGGKYLFMKGHIKNWNDNYQLGRFNRYPYDEVVSFVLSNYSSANRDQTRILDLGCGGGNHVKFLRDEGFDFYGVDGSEESIRITDNLLHTKSDGKLFVADFTKLPFESQYFDAIIDRQSMGHNRIDDIVLITKEIYRILKKGGRYHGHVFGINDAGFSQGTLIGSNDYDNFKGGHFKMSHLVHGFTVEEIKSLFNPFSQLSVQRQVTYDVLSNYLQQEIYYINATK